MNLKALSSEGKIAYLIKPILKVLQEAGGQLERSEIKERISDLDDQIAEYAETEKKSKKTGNVYKEFNFKFNFAIKDLYFAELLTFTNSSPIVAISKMSPKKFEAFSRALLNRMGVEFTEKGVQISNDGGIDGYGYHTDANDFRTTRVVIQCKRYNVAPVSEPEINQFLGAMNKYQADFGVFITNGRFTNAAKTAAREGSPITLIDGNELVRLVIRYELYITPVKTYVLDEFYNIEK